MITGAVVLDDAREVHVIALALAGQVSRLSRLNGSAPPALVALAGRFAAADSLAVSLASDVCGRSDVRPGPGLAQSATEHIGATEAAALLGVTAHQVATLCRAGRFTARKTRGRWLLDRAEIENHVYVKGQT